MIERGSAAWKGSGGRSECSLTWIDIERVSYMSPRGGSSRASLLHLRCRLPTGGMEGISRWLEGVEGLDRRTCSGFATIMWQSMKIPGTPFDTHERMGAPNTICKFDVSSTWKVVAIQTHRDVGNKMAGSHGVSIGD